MYNLDVKPSVDKIFNKLAKKDKEQMRRVESKILQILEDPHHYKPLRKPLDGFRRAQVGSFVITFRIDEDKHSVVIVDYDHHDYIYK